MVVYSHNVMTLPEVEMILIAKKTSRILDNFCSRLNYFDAHVTLK